MRLWLTICALAGLAFAEPDVPAAPRVVRADPADGVTVAGVPLADAQAIWQIELQRLDAKSLRGYLARPEPAVRARAARAVGRLRVEAGVALLARVAADPDARVRREAAFALGQTPGSAALLKERWTVEADRHVRAELALALGRQGGPEAIDLLVEALQGPQSVEAADALGRLGIRKVQGATSDRVVGALLDTLRLPIGDTRLRAAWALARMGLTRTSADHAIRMRHLVQRDGDARVRAWMVRAWSGVAADASRGEVLAATAKDRADGVRIATARALAKAPFPGAAPILVGMLSDPELDVRVEAIDALATTPGVDLAALLARSFASAEPVERAAALRALAPKGGLPEPVATYTKADEPMVVRVAAVAALKDRNRLLSLALRAEEPPIRTAAAGVLLEDDAPRLAELLELLAAKDTPIAQAAADTLAAHPDPGAERALLELLGRKDLTPETAASAIRALDAIYATGRLPRPGAAAAEILRPWLRLRRLDDVAGRLAALLKVDPPPPRHPAIRIPDLRDVLELRSARIFTNRGEVRVRLDPAEAPYTVWNFATLAEKGWFDGLVFHRVVPDFVAQTGDPRGDGWGGPGWEIPDEINPISYESGTLGMALSGPDTGGSQWFITLSPQYHLDGGYTAFGHVVSGMQAARDLRVGDRIDKVVIERVR